MIKNKSRIALLGGTAILAITIGACGPATSGNTQVTNNSVVSAGSEPSPAPIITTPTPTQAPALSFTSSCKLIRGNGGYNGIEPQVDVMANSTLVIAYIVVLYTNTSGTIVGEDNTIMPSVSDIPAGTNALIVPGEVYDSNPPANATGCELSPASAIKATS